MNSKLFGCLSAAVLGAAITIATPAMAFRGGGGFGGMHGGFGGGGMHFGGGGFGGGGMRFGGAAPFTGGGFRGSMVTGRSVFVPGGDMVTGRSVFVPGGDRFTGAPFAGQRFGVNRFNNFAFRRNAFFFRNRFFFRHHHHFRNFAFVGALGWPYYYDYGYGGCGRQVWTDYGWQWTNACDDYGYGYGY